MCRKTVKRQYLKYNPRLKEKARQLRKNATLAETILWRYLKGKQRKGFDFHRQKPIDEFIVDFFCPELMLAIEIDGVTHDEKRNKDIVRQEHLESLGVRFLRFYDSDVRDNIDGVITAIDKWIEEHTPPADGGHPSREGN